jgi:CDP-diacylglycerol--serine O-phosphatidyltransferase
MAILLGDFYISGWLILIGMFLDVGDGVAARLLNAQSEVGKELDSMADLVTFGVAPAYLYFLLAPGDAWFYFIPGIIYLLGCALRLAIFNTLETKKTFTGLATPAGAFFMFGIFMSYHMEVPIISKIISDDIGYFIIPVFLIVMMLSRLEMFSIKSMRQPFWNNPYHVISFLTFLIVLYINPPLAPCAAVLTYIILALISGRSLLKFTRRKKQL